MVFSLFCVLLYFAAASTSLEMNDILKDLSWPLKLKILNEISEPKEKIAHMKPTSNEPNGRGQQYMTTRTTLRRENVEIPVEPASLVNNETVQVKVEPPPNRVPIRVRNETIAQAQTPERRVSIQLLRAARRRANPEEESDEKDMRLKLFRLMYETVRDSDLKVKRAELIKDHYTNSSSFEIGYLIGDITDKANIIADISTTVKRFQKNWKPIEHINAYEQISNQAIEITHLIDLVRVVNKRESDKIQNK